MEAAIALIVAAVLVIALIGLLRARIGATAGRQRRKSRDERDREAAIAAQIEVEEHDIEEMIEAQNELRRRLGHPTIGDELAEGIRPRPEDEGD